MYFTTPHFDGYPAILVRLERIALDELEELIVEAWLVRAPKRLAQEYVDNELGIDRAAAAEAAVDDAHRCASTAASCWGEQ